MSENTITARGLRRVHGSGSHAFEAVRGIDLDIASGTIHALLGVNGAGKTSTLEVIEGLARPSAGEVRVIGMDPIANRAAVRRRTGVLLQRSGFVADLTVTETLQMWAATVTDARPVGECLTMLDLADRAGTAMRALSGGEQRRVDLACTLMGRPDVVMLDEPTTGLDPESRRQVWRLIRALRDGGATVLLTTHYLDEAEALADDLSIMRAGKIVRSGTPAQIVADHPSEISFATPPDTRLTATLPHSTNGDVTREGGRTIVHVDDLQAELATLLRWAETYDVRLDRLVARTASLESVFLAVADEDIADPDIAPTQHAAPPHELEGSVR
ncbi:MAG: ABC transporter ATP-binding protein [Marmoricola sp.]